MEACGLQIGKEILDVFVMDKEEKISFELFERIMKKLEERVKMEMKDGVKHGRFVSWIFDV
jgi:hypothetical protein